jgi:hypothetical protein
MEEKALAIPDNTLDFLELNHDSGMPLFKLGKRKAGRPSLWKADSIARIPRSAYTRIVSDNVRSLLTADNRELDRCLKGQGCIQARQIAAVIVCKAKEGNPELIKIILERVEGKQLDQAGSTNIQINIAPGFQAPKPVLATQG